MEQSDDDFANFADEYIQEGKVSGLGDALVATTVLDDGTSTVSSLGVRRFDYVRDRGSHENGNCDPCVFFSTNRGCLKGARCRYCHLSHPNWEKDKNKAAHRPRKQTRGKFKAAVHELLQASDGRLEQIHDELQAEARKSPYVRKLLQGYLDVEFDGQLSFPAPYNFVPLRSAEASERMPGMPGILCDDCVNDSYASSPPFAEEQVSTATTLGLLMESPVPKPALYASPNGHSRNVGSLRSTPPTVRSIVPLRPPQAPPSAPFAPRAPLPLHAPPSHAPNLITSEPHSPLFGPPDKPPGSLGHDQVEVLNLLLSR